jgi:hypothetical protein
MRKSNTISVAELSDIIESITKLSRTKLEPLGLQIKISKLDPSDETSSSEKTSLPQKVSGVKLYWREINKIAADEKCTIKEARTLYKSQDKGKAPKKSPKNLKLSAKMRESKKNYWIKIRQIADDAGVDNKTAQKMYKDSKIDPTKGGSKDESLIQEILK